MSSEPPKCYKPMKWVPMDVKIQICKCSCCDMINCENAHKDCGVNHNSIRVDCTP